MRRGLCVALAVTLLFATMPELALAKSKRHVTRSHKGYGFLPGYRTPEQIAKDRLKHGYWADGEWYWYYPVPRFYRGRWNGGGFGPCWTRTPIGLVWNCGD